MTKKQLQIPDCPNDCKAWHSPNQVAAFIATSRGMVYYLMRTGKLAYKDTEIGKRINHKTIEKFINTKPLPQ